MAGIMLHAWSPHKPSGGTCGGDPTVADTPFGTHASQWLHPAQAHTIAAEHGITIYMIGGAVVTAARAREAEVCAVRPMKAVGASHLRCVAIVRSVGDVADKLASVRSCQNMWLNELDKKAQELFFKVSMHHFELVQPHATACLRRPWAHSSSFCSIATAVPAPF